jgi:hypothetical protein
MSMALNVPDDGVSQPAETVSKVSDSVTITSTSSKLPLQIRYLYIPYISNISTKEMTFDLRIDIDLLWTASDKELEEFAKSRYSYTPTFVPNLVFQNAKTVDVSQVPLESGSPFSIQNGKNFVRLKVVGTFLNNFDVFRFPFDVQKLRMNVSLSFKNAEEVDFVCENADADVMYVLTENNAIADWVIFACDFESKVGSDGFACLQILVGVRRTSSYIAWKHFFPCLLITFASFLSFYLSDSADRMNYLVTMLLTLVAFNFAITDLLPFNPNPTFTDLVFMTSFSFVSMLLFKAGVAPLEEEFVFFWFSCILFSSLCLIFCITSAYFFVDNNLKCADTSFLLRPESIQKTTTYKSKGHWRQK